MVESKGTEITLGIQISGLSEYKEQLKKVIEAIENLEKESDILNELGKIEVKPYAKGSLLC